jgi:nitroimidazol reductase NimA-like FMN-containing flavoprotein (pyridoxamine 5'-phosphate oxidase superfamily)
MFFTESQLSFLKGKYIARIATTSNDEPHISPIYFTFDRESIFFATESSTSKFRDIVKNPKASVVVDEFDADWLHGTQGPNTTERALVVLGRAIAVNDNGVHKSLRLAFMEKYPDFRATNYPIEATAIIRVFADKIWEHHYP